MSSTIPAVLEALVGAFEAGLDTTVHDGQPTVAETPDYLVVGADPSEDPTAVEFDRDWAQLGARRVEETYDVLCYLVAGTGDTDRASLRQVRTRVFALLDAAAQALRDDPSLGGRVRLAALLGAGELTTSYDDGISVGLRFRVRVTARIDI